MLTIDGSLGEGGGQVLRTSLSLSMLTGKPFRIVKIRAGRAKPGLLRQHLTSVQAAAKICGAKLGGTGLGSQDLEFWPGQIRAGDYHFSVGTAGSTMLVLQAILPALMLARGPSSLILEGGTHNPHAPPVDFLLRAFLPVIQRMGPRVEVQLERFGFYPKGGGRVSVSIEPASQLEPFELTERGPATRRLCEATVVGLPEEIARRELNTIAAGLDWPNEVFRSRRIDDGNGPGNFVTIQIDCQHVTELFTGFGQRGVRAEDVAADVLQHVQGYLSSDAPVGPYLADQLLLPLAVAGAGKFVTSTLTPHARTNIDVIGQFLEASMTVNCIDGGRYCVQVN
jgi:RNA 3'-terminal phosphate cyclase (ATP)